MKTGNETWKWGLVFVLLAIFLVTANQAYVHITSQEDFPPPDDYLKGDSWDIEHQSGPGAGQALELPPEMQTNDMPIIPETDEDEQNKDSDLSHKEEIDWNQVPNPAGE
ncbi:MAG: hypothetical protein PWR01_3086 [Clostridiales bacterium]|jgi:hypothetical protein|nr:hypothetical protein [Clostridiales bacterium]MDN5282013.1 hypothetical protein [Candidatus Ozemobacter sp.]